MPSSRSAQASAARRRRWLLLRQTATPEQRDPEPVSTPTDVELLQDAPRAEPVSIAPVMTVAPSPPTPPALPADALSTSCLRALLSRPAPLTWMLIGDSLEPSAGHEREWRSFSGRLSDVVRHVAGRARDVFIVHTAAGQRLEEVAVDAAQNVARFRPDIVLVTLGPQEAASGRRGLTAFERNLIALIGTAAAARAVPILSTPPQTPAADPEAAVHQLIYAEAIRAVAAEYDVPLVDHFAHWETAAARPAGNSAWFEAAASTPGRYGHEQLARRIVVDLQLQPASTAHSGVVAIG
jgi:hypothetical protein